MNFFPINSFSFVNREPPDLEDPVPACTESPPPPYTPHDNQVMS